MDSDHKFTDMVKEFQISSRGHRETDRQTDRHTNQRR